ncbi:MAG: hypothetical protein OXC80_13310 [Gammaproteobacteria bacterium]|nr:hypothetical protein [Gammaproteobacteria bacterium]
MTYSNKMPSTKESTLQLVMSVLWRGLESQEEGRFVPGRFTSHPVHHAFTLNPGKQENEVQ